MFVVKNTSSPHATISQMFFKIGFLNNFANFMGKHLLNFSHIFKNTFFDRTPLVAASGRGL